MIFRSREDFDHREGSRAEKDTKRIPPEAAPGAPEAAQSFDSLGRGGEFVRSPFCKECREKTEQQKSPFFCIPVLKLFGAEKHQFSIIC